MTDGGGARQKASLGSFANASMALAAVVLAIGIVVVSISFSNLLSARRQLFERLEPALVQTEKLRTSLLDQETGIRGYAQTHDQRFLEPYEAGQSEEIRLTDALRRSLADELAPIRNRLSAITSAAARWRREAAGPIIDASGDGGDGDAAALLAKTAFDDVRRAVDRLESEVARRHARARTDLDTATTSLAVAIGFALASVTAAGLVGAWLLRRRVIVPIEQLVAQTDHVDLGRFDARIDVRGPREIEQLSTRVDEMRVRLVAELAATAEVTAELSEKSQSLERSNRDLEQFAYVASHDLQEPLRKVASFCQLIEQRYADQLDEKGRLYIEYAVDGAKRMQALISDLLDFSRVGRNTGKFVECDLGVLAETVLESYSGPATESGADITLGDLPVVLGDRSLLMALLQNLLGNALKYRRLDLAPVITLTATTDGTLWTFTFTDNGIGIDEDFRERVFVIFQRLHGRDAFEGTGIGLALCKKIVEFHGGEIWIDDGPPEGGTTIRWTLPASLSPDEGYARLHASTAEAPVATAPPTNGE